MTLAKRLGIRDQIPPEHNVYVDLVHVKLMPRIKRPFACVARKFGMGGPAQMSSASTDYSSKLRDPSQNSICVVSNPDFNATKLNKLP
ncbi:hypothetical protein AVEN_41921-1 [Araneus ventricosus]|uniref:Uncharacterized protein n=1 Tax=Araneus ventricosus TaxID=182803 RepID=A0A4Y2ACY6_ARAVE|nr:hypothetical protein AVEN_41921-1 [Araneus ventricosus]